MTSNPYLNTKWESEQILCAGHLDSTIVRPGIVFGVGDEFLTSLVRIIRCVPVFPLPDKGQATLQVVSIEDVIQAVVTALERPMTIGKTYDVVGPERLTFREIVVRVCDALDLKTSVIDTPINLQYLAASFMDRFLSNPILTRYQLAMLAEGVTGDSSASAQDLDIQPRAMTKEVIAKIARSIHPYMGFSLRLPARKRLPDRS